ncbi:phosphatidylinositol mannoside acyltransferase [Cellulomonas composti]|uniref:Lipid A biosynthesis lauroyl acyltransferase n=1 Tax=Cellulomonas composti TaxID=266130 RepID=A0A511J6Q6_9CELL|nr:phosphatidylinositol mannoside acyltransferase [Cellulomonas composti]GEL93675.1 lipid A biosynthesis lauroyl acyltransferase [Cellulomonas composti]
MSLDAGRLYGLAWRVAPRLPGAFVRGLCNVGADAAWLLHGTGVRRLEVNLARVRPELSRGDVRRLSRAGMRSYVRYFGETFTLGSLTEAQIDARVRATGLEALRVHTDAGRTALLALGHMGNWDLAGAWATRHIAPVTTVAERLEPEEVFQDFLRLREGLGLRILALGDGDVFRDLVRVARSGPGLLPLLADRDLTARGVEVDLFGHRARVAAGPAALAVSTGAPLFATAITYERLHGARRRAAGSPWGIRIDFIPVPEVADDVPRADRVRAITQAWLDVLAEAIHARPQDWHMLQRVFVDDLDRARDAALRAAATAEAPAEAPADATVDATVGDEDVRGA